MYVKMITFKQFYMYVNVIRNTIGALSDMLDDITGIRYAFGFHYAYQVLVEAGTACTGVSMETTAGQTEKSDVPDCTGKTTLTNVVNADYIYVMKDGRIAEEGTHASLMEQQGYYHEMFTLQAKNYIAASEEETGGYAVDRNHLYLMKAIAEGRDISNLSVTEEGCLRNLLNEGFCVKDEDGRVQVAALSVSNGDFGKITEYLTALSEYIRLREEKHSYYDEIKKVIERYSTFLLKEDLDYYVGMSSPLRAVLASLWLDKGVYTGGNSRFAALYASALALYAFYAPFLLAYTFLAAGIYGFSVFSLSRKQYGLGKRQINTERRMGYLKDLFKEKNTAKEMRIFGTGAHFFRIWEEANAVYRKERLDMDNKGADYRNIAALADYVLYAGMVFSLLYSVKAGGCDVGTFVMLMGMVSRCNGSIKSICMAECGARSAAIRT